MTTNPNDIEAVIERAREALDAAPFGDTYFYADENVAIHRKDISALIVAASRVRSAASARGVADGLDWLRIARAAGEHGVRYRTNRALCSFLRDIGAAPSSPAAAPEVDREAIARAIRHSRNERKSPGFGYVCEDEPIEEEWLKDVDAILALFRTPPAPAGEIFAESAKISAAEPRPVNAGNIVYQGEEWVPLSAYREAMAGWKAAGSTGFIAGRDAAAEMAANLVECDRDCGFRELADRGDVIVSAIRAIEPGEKGE